MSAIMTPHSSSSNGATPPQLPAVRLLLLDDDPTNLHLRSTILRQHGYECMPAGSIDEALELLDVIDIAVLDYHLGGGEFGTEVAATLRRRRPHIPIIILSATLERFFGGVEDMHLLKGYSSIADLLAALSSLEAKRRGAPVVVDARDFFYSRISRAIGTDVLVQIFNDRGIWLFCNDLAAGYLGQTPRVVHRSMHLRRARELHAGLARRSHGSPPNARDIHRSYAPRSAACPQDWGGGSHLERPRVSDPSA